jgi:hypothetical protein
MRRMLIAPVALLAVTTIAADRGCSDPEPKQDEEVAASEPAPAKEEAPGKAGARDEARRRFPDYQPKRTPDTVIDYHPRLAPRIAKLPPARLDRLLELIVLLEEHKKRAAGKPGQFVKGNQILGADEKEYEPSEDEMLASEIGDRIRAVAASTSKEQLEAQGVPPQVVEYGAIRYRHVDVMGSGRFFYASEPVKATIPIGK